MQINKKEHDSGQLIDCKNRPEQNICKRSRQVQTMGSSKCNWKRMPKSPSNDENKNCQ